MPAGQRIRRSCRGAILLDHKFSSLISPLCTLFSHPMAEVADTTIASQPPRLSAAELRALQAKRRRERIVAQSKERMAVVQSCDVEDVEMPPEFVEAEASRQSIALSGSADAGGANPLDAITAAAAAGNLPPQLATIASLAQALSGDATGPGLDADALHAASEKISSFMSAFQGARSPAQASTRTFDRLTLCLLFLLALAMFLGTSATLVGAVDTAAVTASNLAVVLACRALLLTAAFGATIRAHVSLTRVATLSELLRAVAVVVARRARNGGPLGTVGTALALLGCAKGLPKRAMRTVLVALVAYGIVTAAEATLVQFAG
jgi:hypothetical protein